MIYARRSATAGRVTRGEDLANVVTFQPGICIDREQTRERFLYERVDTMLRNGGFGGGVQATSFGSIWHLRESPRIYITVGATRRETP